MPIPFREIPAGLLVPGQYQEVSTLSRGSNKKISLLIGLMLDGGTAAEAQEYTLTSAQAARDLFGEGSDLATLAASYLGADKTLELRAIGLKEKTDGVAACYTITFSPSRRHPGGMIPLYLNGIDHSFGVASGDTPTQIVTKALARINSQQNGTLDAAAGETEGSLTLTSLHKGETGNHLNICLGLYGETTPMGIGVQWSQTQTGAGNPDIKQAIAEMKEVRYHYLGTNLTDGPNMAKLEAELNRRYSALAQKGGRLFIPLSGRGSDMTAWVDAGRNNPHVSVLARAQNPESEAHWLGRGMALVARQLAADPACNLNGLALGLLTTQPLSFDTRQGLLEKGISTYTCGADGLAYLERQVTCYTQDAKGNRDTSYLDIQIPETIDAIREHINIKCSRVYKGYKMARTSEAFGAGTKVMTPSLFKSFLLSTYSEDLIKTKGWCQDYDTYKDSLLVEMATDNQKTRLNYQHSPVLMGQFLIAAGSLEVE